MTRPHLPSALLAVLAAAAVPAARGQDMIGVQWTGSVLSIDSATGAGTVIGSTGFGVGANAMAVDSSGTIFISQRLGSSGPPYAILTVDPQTGSATPTAVQSAPDMRGLAFDAAGNLWAIVDHSATASGKDELQLVDLATGGLTSVGSTGTTGIQAFAIHPDGTFYAWDISPGNSSPNAPLAGLLTLDPMTGAATDVNPNVGAVNGIQFLSVAPDGTLYGGQFQLSTIDRSTGVVTAIGGSGYSDLRGADFLTSCFKLYGQGCPGSGGFTPQLAVGGCPVAGGALTVAVFEGLGGATAVILLGLQEASLNMGFGCTLNITPVLPAVISVPLSGAGPGLGNITLIGPLPASTAGLSFTMQLFVADPGGVGGFSNTQGLKLVVQ